MSKLIVRSNSIPILPDHDSDFVPEDMKTPYDLHYKVFRLTDKNYVSTSEARFNATKNPLYVWQAIKHCRTEFNLRHSEGISWMTEVANELSINAEPENLSILEQYHKAAARFSSDTSFILLPDWCQDYLGSAAKNVWDLSLMKNKNVELDVLIKKIPGDLGLVRPGWNAFAEFFSQFKNRLALRRYNWLIEDEKSSAEARQLLLEKYALSDERSLLRMFAKARPLMQDSTSLTKPKG